MYSRLRLVAGVESRAGSPVGVTESVELQPAPPGLLFRTSRETSCKARYANPPCLRSLFVQGSRVRGVRA